MATAQITAAICTYCRSELIGGAVASIAGQDLPPDQFDILIVDNSPQSGPSMGEDACSRISNLRWLQAPSVGLSGARNLATAQCETPLIAFLDDDAVAAENWLSAILSAFSQGENIVAGGGRVDPLWLAPRPPWLPDGLLGHLSLVDWGGEHRLLGPQEWISGTNMAFRVEHLRRVGGFSSKFGRHGGGEVLLSNEENEVIARLRREGGEVVYVPEATVQHLVPPERLTQSWFRRRVVWQAISDYIQRQHELFANAAGHWNTAMRFDSDLAPEYQLPRSLYLEQSDPEVFARQMSALYSFTIVMLTGFCGIAG